MGVRVEAQYRRVLWLHARRSASPFHPGVELRANLKSISHRCHLFEVAFVWALTKETIHLPLGCLQVGEEERERGGPCT